MSGASITLAASAGVTGGLALSSENQGIAFMAPTVTPAAIISANVIAAPNFAPFINAGPRLPVFLFSFLP
jgi:hypothetical protein